MTARQTVLLAGAGSATLLLIAFGFQYLAGLLPCAMCLWQRWPHVLAIVLSAVGMAISGTWLAILGGLTMLSNAGIALYHTGVERDWWEGPTSCTSAGGENLGLLSGSDLLNTDTTPALILCDQVAWEMAGLSMASWNGVGSLILAIIWFAAAARAYRPQP